MWRTSWGKIILNDQGSRRLWRTVLERCMSSFVIYTYRSHKEHDDDYLCAVYPWLLLRIYFMDFVSHQVSIANVDKQIRPWTGWSTWATWNWNAKKNWPPKVASAEANSKRLGELVRCVLTI